MKIVVVEDSPEIAALLKMFLSRSRADVLAFTENFRQIADEVDWESVDAIVCDRMLEDFNGEDLLAWLEEHHPDVQRIMLTGSVSFTEEEAHAHKVLIKPVSPDVLVQAVHGER